VPPELSADHGALLGWGAAELRPLPWRATRDPWAVLVSELMAQQTGVDRVVPKWHAFLDRWPDPSGCAAAELGEVLEVWAGLGYPRRARYLHLAAGRIVARHDGMVPDDLTALLALPGIGPYTARAVLAFAFERDIGVVDTNVGRVLARWSGRRLTPRAAQVAADGLVPPGAGWLWNQSLMELGARVCRPRSPRCGECPVAPGCAWRAAGQPGPDPALGSAGVSGPQARFVGSDREARGRLLRAVLAAPGGVPPGAVPAAAGLADDPERAAWIAASLVADGLAVAAPDGALVAP